MVDLHLHTTCSDGALTPTEVVDLASARGVKAIAITDHDTLAGNEEAMARGTAVGLPVVPAVEVSTHFGGITFHLLGYGLRRMTGRVQACFDFLEDSRKTRNPRIVDKLRKLGIDISLEEVLQQADGSVVGRPHFAAVLLRKGVVKTMQEAFDRFLGRGARAYVDKERLDPRQACEVIGEAGGVAVLAHPGVIEQDHPGKLPRLLEELCACGLAGLEAYYSTHTRGQTRRYRKLAAAKNLLLTGGSDFHGGSAEGPAIGTGHGDLRVPDHCYEGLRDRLDSMH